MPPAYRLMIMSSKPPRRRLPLGTRRGVNSPSRSRGTWISMGPTWLSTVFAYEPLREFFRPLAAFPSRSEWEYPRWESISAVKPRSRVVFTSAGIKPPSPLRSTSPASIRANKSASTPESFNSWAKRLVASFFETAKSDISSKTTDILRVIPPDHPVHKQIYRLDELTTVIKIHAL